MFSILVKSPNSVAAHAPATGRRLAERFAVGWMSRILAIALLAVYVGWNFYWLAQFRLAPSLFQALTGLPCPTTGCTRSLQALCRGELLESLRFNALTIPICLLLAATLAQPGRQLLGRHRRVALRPGLVVSWAIILPLAMVLKWLGDPQYW